MLLLVGLATEGGICEAGLASLEVCRTARSSSYWNRVYKSKTRRF